MTDWHAIDALFEAALERPPEERKRFLRETCAGQPALRARLDALLEAAEGVDPWLERPAEAIRAAVQGAFSEGLDEEDEGSARVVAVTDPLVGSRLGPWRVLRRLARGGMGAVYLAERADGQFQQRAAIKILRPGLDTGDLLQRFLAERQILAGLTHPNITRLLDGGATPDGRPYLVLEYVDGEQITRYCERRELDVDARLRLFVTVCRAVQHAHRNLVLHRDLKPSNILVTAEGRVKLFDFGIAKLLDDAAQGRAPHTRTGSRLMTPEYASPEQVRGDPVTTASDVYQLGMLLYELLVGERPYEVEGLSAVELEHTIRERDPPLPSARVREVRPPLEAERFRRGLRGDLDAVILQALRKEPDRRYGSVERLMEDVERHLEGLPVRARGDGLLYRARKFARRRRLPLAVAAMVLLSAVGYVVLSTVHSARLTRERDRARVEAAKAEEVKRFVIDLFETANPDVTGSEEVTVRQLVDEGARRVRTELAGQPAVQAEMLAVLADLYWRVERVEPSLELAREALEVRRSHFPEESPEVAASLRQMAMLTAKYAAGGARRVEADPEALLRHAAEVTRAVHGPRHPLYAHALHEWAMSGNHPAERRRALQDSAIAILRRVPTEKRLLAEVLAEAAYGTEPRERARRLAEEALALRQEVLGEEHGTVAESLSDLALIIEPTRPDSAERLLRRAVEIHQAAAGPGDPRTLTIQNNLAGVLRDRGKYDEAVPIYREVLALRTSERHDPVVRAYAAYGLAASLVGLGRHEEAESLLREALEAFPSTDVRHNTIRLVLGRALAGQGKLAEAERVLRTALEAVEGGGGGPAQELRQALGEVRAAR